MRTRPTRRRPTPTFAIAMLALILSLGGTSYAASTALKKGSVSGKALQTDSVTSSKVKNGSLLSKDFKAGQLPAGAKGATGPAGATGATGAKGDTGASGATGAKGDPGVNLWAAVSDVGQLRRGSGVVGSRQIAEVSGQVGQYEVTFNRSITSCAYTATVGSDTSSPFGVASVRPQTGKPNAVFVATRDKDGFYSDRSFFLQVAC